jgi:Helix-turn-helix domain
MGVRKRLEKEVAPAKPITERRKLYKRATAAHVLNQSISTLRRLERQGPLTPVKMGRRDIRYPAEQVEAIARNGY